MIVNVHFFIKYLNERLDSIDRKLDRIQPKIRRLFAILNEPQFNTKVEKFLHFLLKQSSVDGKRDTLLPKIVANPILQIDTLNFRLLNVKGNYSLQGQRKELPTHQMPQSQNHF